MSTCASILARSPYHLFFLPSLPAPSPLTTVSMFSVSVLLFLFCLLNYFIHYIPHISGIIWYLSFSGWLISLNIIFSRSIHPVPKGKISFFFFFLFNSRVVFHLHFRNELYCGTSFHVLIYHLYILCGEKSVHVFCPDSDWIVLFLPLDFGSSSYILGHFVVRYVMCKYFLPTCGLSHLHS